MKLFEDSKKASEKLKETSEKDLYQVTKNIIKSNPTMPKYLFNDIDDIIKKNKFDLKLNQTKKLKFTSRFDFGELMKNVKTVDKANDLFGTNGKNALAMSSIRALDRKLQSLQ